MTSTTNHSNSGISRATRSVRTVVGGRGMALRVTLALLFCAIVFIPATGRCDAGTNLFATPLAPSLPDTGPSLLRVLGALALVLGLFLGGAWLVRSGRFSNLRRSSRLNVLETRSLGARQAISVVAYGSERFLIGSTPAGINLISHLASSPEAEPELPAQPAPNPSFGQALVQVLRGQNSGSGKKAANT